MSGMAVGVADIIVGIIAAIIAVSKERHRDNE
jgi:hypothetical protein